MEYRLKAKVLNDTDKCVKDYACLKNGECLCEVIENISDRVIFINPSKKMVCQYMMSFGYSHVCNCPTRKEIYKIYKR